MITALRKYREEWKDGMKPHEKPHSITCFSCPEFKIISASDCASTFSVRYPDGYRPCITEQEALDMVNKRLS